MLSVALITITVEPSRISLPFTSEVNSKDSLPSGEVTLPDAFKPFKEFSAMLNGNPFVDITTRSMLLSDPIPQTLGVHSLKLLGTTETEKSLVFFSFSVFGAEIVSAGAFNTLISVAVSG